MQPQWSDDGRELFYLAPDGHLVVVPVIRSVVGEPLDIGTPTPLFRLRVGAVDDVAMRQYVVSKDAARVLVGAVVEESASPITLILQLETACPVKRQDVTFSKALSVRRRHEVRVQQSCRLPFHSSLAPVELCCASVTCSAA